MVPPLPQTIRGAGATPFPSTRRSSSGSTCPTSSSLPNPPTSSVSSPLPMWCPVPLLQPLPVPRSWGNTAHGSPLAPQIQPLAPLCPWGALPPYSSPPNLWELPSHVWLHPGWGKDRQEGWRSFKSPTPLETELKSHTPLWRRSNGKPHPFLGDLNCFATPFLGKGGAWRDPHLVKEEVGLGRATPAWRELTSSGWGCPVPGEGFGG